MGAWQDFITGGLIVLVPSLGVVALLVWGAFR